METKLCIYCDPPQYKDVSEFYKRASSGDGLSNKCKACERRDHQNYYQRKKKEARKKVSNRNSKLKINYKLAPEEYQRMWDEQKGLCKICKKPSSRLLVDHDHETGKVRWLLCDNCNHGLGRFGDDIEVMESAVQYLKESRNDRSTS